MKASNIIKYAICLLAVFSTVAINPARASADEIRFGVLQVLQALPLFVAEEQGFFGEAGLEVGLVPFQSAAEKDIAMKSGAIDGYFGDLFTPLVIEGNGLDISIVASNYQTGDKARMFALIAGSQSGVDDIAGLAGKQVGISNNSVIAYVTEQLIAAGPDSPADVELLDMKNIGLRMQLLMSGELDAATLPEPLVTAALKGGAKLLADDRGMPVSQTVLIFSQPFLTANGDDVSGFLSAVDKANAWIAANPDAARKVMIARTRLPEPLQQNYPIPVFPTSMLVPDEQTVMQAVAWLRAAGVLKQDLTYTELVNGEYLP